MHGASFLVVVALLIASSSSSSFVDAMDDFGCKEADLNDLETTLLTTKSELAVLCDRLSREISPARLACNF